MSLLGVMLLVALALLLVSDAIMLWRSGGRILLVLEALAFLVAGVLLTRQELASQLATAVGITRGVDVLLYPLSVFLFREALVSRYFRHRQAERITELVRALALRPALPPSAPDELAAAPPRSDEPS